MDNFDFCKKTQKTWYNNIRLIGCSTKEWIFGFSLMHNYSVIRLALEIP